MIRITPKILYNNFIFSKKIIAYDFCSDSSNNGSDKKDNYLDNLEVFFKDNTNNAEEKVVTRIHKHIKSASIFKKKKTSNGSTVFSDLSRKLNQNIQPSLSEILQSNDGIKKFVRKQNNNPINKEIQLDFSIKLQDILKNNQNIKKFVKNKASKIDTSKSNSASLRDNIQEILDQNSLISSHQKSEKASKNNDGKFEKIKASRIESNSRSESSDIQKIFNKNSSIRQQQWEYTFQDQVRDASEFDDIQGILEENISNELDDQIIKDSFRSEKPQDQFTHHFKVLSSGTPQSQYTDISSVDMGSNQLDQSIQSPMAAQSKQDDDELMELLNNIDFHQVSRVFPVNILDTDYESFIDGVSSKRLNIFENTQSEDASQLEEKGLNFLDVVESCEFRQLNTHVPPTQFHEWIQWTQDKKLWRFPIDNEQDSEELSVKFHEHVFPQQYLTGRLPKTGPIGQFMNYVCVGLSQSSCLTVEQKRAHIRWYEDYLASKVDECNIAVQKSKTN